MSALAHQLAHPLRTWWTNQRLSATIRKLQSQGPSDEILNELRRFWGNPGFSATTSYLRAVTEAAQETTGPVLECGSGLSTIVLASLVGRRLFSLEHIAVWADRVESILHRTQLSANIIRTQMISYGDFDWYEVTPNLPEEFSLVVCDGPPGMTRGGRYGLLPVMRERLHGAEVLLDDASRAEEQKILSVWKTEFGTTYELESERYARLRLPAH